MRNSIANHQEAVQLAAALNVPLFRAKHYLPDYKEIRIGRWKLARSGFSLGHGYYTGLWAVWGMPVLLRDAGGDGRNWETWMSLSPHEIESQEIACRYAFGHTVIMGLGMGWAAANIAFNPSVRLVTVVEQDREVIELFRESGVVEGLPAEIAGKIRIVDADALEWIPDEPADFLFADIWRCPAEPQSLADVRRMQKNVRPGMIYFWGQELVIYSLADKTHDGCGESGLWGDAMRRCVAERIGLPLLLPDDIDYPGMIAEVARLRRERSPERTKIEPPPVVTLRPIADSDMEFLCRLYASTRAAEKSLAGWDDGTWDAFIRMQFDLQHTQYMKNYLNPSFDLIMLGDIPIGRLYVDRRPEEIRIIDICLLPEYRGRGMGAWLMKKIIREGDEAGLPVTLHVEINNPVLSLYMRLGFRQVNSREVYCFMKRFPGGTNEDSAQLPGRCGDRGE